LDAQAILTPDGKAYVLDAGAFKLLDQAALAACDASDGLADGLISDVEGCKFDPAQLQCKAGQSQACFSPAQVEAARKIYDGIRTSKGAVITRFGSARGAELNLVAGMVRRDGKPGAAELTAANSMHTSHGPSATINDYNFDVDALKPSEMGNLPALGPDGGSLADFKKRGGKLVLYSGWADPSISPDVPIGFYRTHAKALGGTDALDPFLRLFMVPGMAHCGGGDGPETIDLLSVLEAWVDKGTAPASVIAYKPVKKIVYPAEPRFPMPADDVVFSRPVFPYPAYARYDGKGDPKMATSFTSAAPAAR
jgi:feruloyl esterase